MKKALLLYESIYGNTKKVAMAISRGLEAGNVIVDTVSIENINIDKVDNYDLIGIGVSLHSNEVTKRTKVILNKIENLNLEGMYGFTFKTYKDYKLTRSTRYSIHKQLKRMKVIIIHPPIAEMVINKDGSLNSKILFKMERIGLKISVKLNNLEKSTTKAKDIILKYINFILFGGGPVFFFIRAIQLASLGGDTFGSMNPIASWTILSMEIVFSGMAGIIALASLLFELRYKKDLIIIRKLKAQKVFLIIGIITYALHFVRVAIWLSLIIIF